MDSLIFGIVVYLIISAITMFYNLEIKHENVDWLSHYLPWSVLGFAIIIAVNYLLYC